MGAGHSIAPLLTPAGNCQISGAPGIGKTTLAEMLLYRHLEQGYEPVAIQADIAEGKKFFKPDAKRLFYYDLDDNLKYLLK